MTNEDLSQKIGNQIATLESNMKEAIKPINMRVKEMEVALESMRTNLQGQVNAGLAKIDRNFQINCEQHENLMERVAKIEGTKPSWKERGKQMGMGMVGAGIVLGATALIDWAFSGPNTVQSQQ